MPCSACTFAVITCRHEPNGDARFAAAISSAPKSDTPSSQMRHRGPLGGAKTSENQLAV